MAQLGCKCGERMTKTDCPSPCSLYIFYKEEVDRAIYDNPNIMLHDFLSGWDVLNNCQHDFMDRPEPVDYWFCPVCKRVYEVQDVPHGRWIRVFKKIADNNHEEVGDWKQIYIMFDTETDAATEDNWEITLFDYLQQHNNILYYLSPNETVVCAVDKKTCQVICSYVLEDSWTPNVEM